MRVICTRDKGRRWLYGGRVTMVCIDRRFRGPPDSANGGYFAGLLARELGGSDIVVTLKSPAPLNTDLRVVRSGEEASLFHGDLLLAVAERRPLAFEVPAPPALDQASAAEARFRPDLHLYPGCFVCGPARQAGDGWRIFPGEIAEGRVAAGWTPPSEFGDVEGRVKPEFVWAALDCPGYFAVQEAAGLALLGRMGVVVHELVPTNEPLIVQGWAIGSDGRKHHAGTALHAADGRLLAAAIQTWVTLR